MKAHQQVPRNALVWILISMFALIAPHAGRVPAWVLLVYAACAGWRLMVYHGRWSFPGRAVKFGLILLACGGLYASYGSLLGLEPTVALLLVAYALKLLELARRQDAYVVLFLGYFICLTELLFSQDLLMVLYLLLTVVLVTTALVALHQPEQQRFHWGSLRHAAVMLAQATPLMLVLFFLFPRVGPLWSVPSQHHAAKTGVSDTMRPGDISKLSQSDEVAFRVQFSGAIPPRSELYWRGLVFSRLREGTWSSVGYYELPAGERRPPPVVARGEPLRYRVIMAPTRQHWLFSLRYAQSGQGGIMEAPDFRLFTPVEVEEQFRYEARSWPRARLEPELSAWRRQTELALPPEGDPETRALARRMRAEAGSDAGYVTAVLNLFRREPFSYTLQPPLLGDNPMDDFLFRTRRGFCEHYAHAFALMMRAAGVPARVVAGYQGGEVNPVNRTVIVHQFDAHAWTEVWLEGEGWRRVDPTAAVAPERIEMGLEQAVAAEGSFLADSPLSPLRYRSINWVNWARLRYDALTYRWQSWVVAFDSQQQLDMLERWLGEVKASRFILVLLGSGVLVLAPVAFSLLFRRRQPPPNPVDRLYLRFCERLASLGVSRQTGETPSVYARRASAALPALANAVRQVTGAYIAESYLPARDASSRERAVEAMRAGLRALSRHDCGAPGSPEKVTGNAGAGINSGSARSH